MCTASCKFLGSDRGGEGIIRTWICASLSFAGNQEGCHSFAYSFI